LGKRNDVIFWASVQIPLKIAFTRAIRCFRFFWNWWA